MSILVCHPQITLMDLIAGGEERTLAHHESKHKGTLEYVQIITWGKYSIRDHARRLSLISFKTGYLCDLHSSEEEG